jgi:hypothetical protein
MTDNYREKAAHARRLARSIHCDDPAIARLLEMAKDFDALAAQAEGGILRSGEEVQQPAQQQQQQQQPQSEDEPDTQ